MTSRGAEKMNNDTIGVDVSKDHLDAHRRGRQSHPAFCAATAREVTKRLSNGSRRRLYTGFVFRPTGPYHRAVERALGIRWRSVRQGQSASGAPLRRGDRQTGEDQVAWMRRS